MNKAARTVQRTYLTLTLFNTLAASLIWGVNTLFLLDAGLNNLEAFAANAFFTAGMVLFEVPTGVLADLKGRRLSFLLGIVTLSLSTLLYLAMWQIAAPFWAWAVVSVFLGLGFTFFSGATEAWLVDAMKGSGYSGRMESVFAKGEIIEGFGMLAGTLAGGFLAQATNLGIPYVLRAGILCISFVVAFKLMHDIGFKPSGGKHPVHEVKRILRDSYVHGLRNQSVRWVILTAPFLFGVIAYGFYALQPYLLELWGDEKAYGIAGLAAAVLAGAQIAGGFLAPHLGRVFRSRTGLMLAGSILTAITIALMGMFANFWVVIGLVLVWGMLFAIIIPVRQAYLNGLISSEQRATVLSFDSLIGSSGGVATQPALGKAADVWGYPTTYVISGIIQAGSIPFAWLARRAAKKPAAQEADRVGENEPLTSPQL